MGEKEGPLLPVWAGGARMQVLGQGPQHGDSDTQESRPGSTQPEPQVQILLPGASLPSAAPPPFPPLSLTPGDH